MLRNAGVGMAGWGNLCSEESHDEDDVVSRRSIRWHRSGGFNRSGGMMMRRSVSGEVIRSHDRVQVLGGRRERERERELG